MALIVKLMSAENRADDQSNKAYRLFSDVRDAEILRDYYIEPDRKHIPALVLTRMDDTQTIHPLDPDHVGNVYVMNDKGTTISSYSTWLDKNS
jgi:hypothetical protein